MVQDNFKGSTFNGCFAVFDGHGGQRAAEFASTKLGTMLEEHPALESNLHGALKQGKSNESKIKQSPAQAISSKKNYPLPSAPAGQKITMKS